MFDDDPHDVQSFASFSSEKNELILIGRHELSLLEDDSVRLLSSLISLKHVNNHYYSSKLGRYFLPTKYKESDGKIYETHLQSGRVYGYTYTKSIPYDVTLTQDNDLLVAEDDRGLTFYKSGTDIRLYKYKLGLRSRKILWLSEDRVVVGGLSPSNRYVVRFLNIEKEFDYYEENELSSRYASQVDFLLDNNYFYVSLGRTVYVYEVPDSDDEEFEDSLSEVTLEKDIQSIKIKGNRIYALHDDGFSELSFIGKEEPELLRTVAVDGLSGIKAQIYDSELFLVGREGVSIYKLLSGGRPEFLRKLDVPFLGEDNSGDILSVIVRSEDLYISHSKKGFLRFKYED